MQGGERFRCSVPAHVVGAGDGDLRQRGNAATDHAGVAELTDPHRAIDALTHQVDKTITGADIQFDLWKTRAERGQCRNHK